jgi:polar amino acid transport system substrate-binding protein
MTKILTNNKLKFAFITISMILPTNDKEWQETVNNFIRNQSSTNLLEKVFGPNSPFLPMSIADQNKCI